MIFPGLMTILPTQVGNGTMVYWSRQLLTDVFARLALFPIIPPMASLLHSHL